MNPERPPAPTSPSPDASAVPVRITGLFSSMLALIPSLAIVCGAFLYFAGYSYIDTYLRSFGLTFGATTMSTGEVMGQRYTVVLYLTITHFFDWLWRVMVSSLLIWSVIAVALGALVYGKRKGSNSSELILEILHAVANRVVNLPNYIIAGGIVVVVAVSSGPAGVEAAKFEREATIAKVQKGCCAFYQSGNIRVRGYPIAETSDRIAIYTNHGVHVLPAEGLHILEKPPSKTLPGQQVR